MISQNIGRKAAVCDDVRNVIRLMLHDLGAWRTYTYMYIIHLDVLYKVLSEGKVAEIIYIYENVLQG